MQATRHGDRKIAGKEKGAPLSGSAFPFFSLLRFG
jgi:hypothetical protein